MAIDPKSIGGQIECLARLTGAPETFVEQVRALFLNKGISLDEEVAPYVAALEEAFLRERKIRSSTGKARQNLQRLQNQFNRLGDAYRKQLGQLKEIRRSLEAYSQVRADQQARGRKKKVRPTVVVSVRRPSVVTRPQRDGRSMVPGPEDLQ
jgi:hypothetical protein